ncbi:hypothetical protein ALP25_00294 [Pseudomonas syringae pv. syringae]|uniref:hypothetical protein n=1 Tax=Pseudomonas syringae TaxID=317 RepID=UPI000EFDC5FF|nr:hypothetical protein [Pseudomonas syringae]RMU60265.1 hypothetical protein ALP25_00294 [Pseudomonas syringae pv. syringae]
MSKLDSIFKKLDKPPRETFNFLWADYAELRCLTSVDGVYGEGHIADLYTESELNLDVDPGGDELDDDLDPDDEVDDEGQSVFLDNEKVSQKWGDICSRLTMRQQTMAGFWPFFYKDGILYNKFEEGNPKHAIYIALLLCSSMRYLEDDRSGEVAASLEEIGYHIFRSIMPTGWEVRPFGAHQRIADAYEGTLIQKFTALAKDISAAFVDVSGIDARDTGDGGLDVVAWHPVGKDQRGHIPISYAQCGCSPRDWEHKQLEASPLNMELKVMPQHSSANYYIMPHDIKSLTGGWERAANLAKVIMIDRSRILELSEQYSFHDALNGAWPHINEAMSYRFQEV